MLSFKRSGKVWNCSLSIKRRALVCSQSAAGSLSMKISVLGAGSWGTALAIVLSNNGHDVTLWEYKTEYVKGLIKHHENKVFLTGISITQKI